MNTASDPRTPPPPELTRERPAPATCETARGPAGSPEGPPAERRPSPVLVVLLRALSAWCT